MKIQYEDKLLLNYNTGVKYEIGYAKFLCFKNDWDIKEFDKIFSIREDWFEINEVFENLKEKNSQFKLFNKFKILEFKSQDDTSGVSDIILTYEDDTIIGESIKYDNDANSNYSIYKYLEEKDKNEIIEKFEIAVNEYIGKNQELHGSPNIWFRPGSGKKGDKKSEKTYKWFFDYLKNKIVSEFNSSIEKKVKILKYALNIEGSIENCNVVHINKKFVIKITKHEYNIDINKVNIQSDPLNDYVNFYHNDIEFGKLQIKFTNGILEVNDRKTKPADFIIDGFEMKRGTLSSLIFKFSKKRKKN